MIARVVTILGLLASAVCAQNVVTADQARALIAEQRQFISQMARGEVNGDSYKVRWYVQVHTYEDGHGETLLSTADVTHYTQVRQAAASANFLSYVDTAKIPGMRQQLDQAFAAFVAQETTANAGKDVQAYLTNVAKPAKDAEMKRILDLLGQLDVALDAVAAQAQIAERTAGVGSAVGGSTAPVLGGNAGGPLDNTPPVAGGSSHPPPPANGPALLGVGSQGGPGAPGVSSPAVPGSTGAGVPLAGGPAGPTSGVPGLIPSQFPGLNPSQVPGLIPGQTPGLIPGQLPPLAPGFPGAGPLVIVIRGDPYAIAQILNLLIAILQQTFTQPYAQAASTPRNPDPYALERALYGTGGLIDQSGRAMGLRPAAIPAFTLSVR